MTHHEPEVAKRNMEAAKRAYDQCIRLHRDQKISADALKRARVEWNSAMLCYLESNTAFTYPTPDQEEEKTR